MSKTVFAIAVLTLGILAVPGAARSETPLSTPEGAADQYVTGRMFYAPTEFSADGKQATVLSVLSAGEKAIQCTVTMRREDGSSRQEPKWLVTAFSCP